MTIDTNPVTDLALRQYIATLAECLSGAVATAGDGQPVALTAAVQWAIARAVAAHAVGGKLIFIGNGGSAAIASHAAIDYTKAGGLRALTFNDGAALTCLSNDLGYEQAFAFQVRAHGQPGDLLIAISSSGRSPNILNAVAAGRECGLAVITFSGFAPDNPLRRAGDMNVYIASDHYGMVELSHQTLCHAILDLHAGWSGA